MSKKLEGKIALITGGSRGIVSDYAADSDQSQAEKVGLANSDGCRPPQPTQSLGYNQNYFLPLGQKGALATNGCFGSVGVSQVCQPMPCVPTQGP